MMVKNYHVLNRGFRVEFSNERKFLLTVKLFLTTTSPTSTSRPILLQSSKISSDTRIVPSSRGNASASRLLTGSQSSRSFIAW
jgi:hypothetical protein